jgi:DNA-binding transcriptional MerR regulator
MKYRVEELAVAAGVRVDTVRFYQAKGLLPPPRRVKRMAEYSEEHLSVLKKIRRYQAQGFSLAVIGKLLTSRRISTRDSLLAAVAEQGGQRTLTRAELAAESGVPEPLLASLEAAGLLVPVRGEPEPVYSEADLKMARAGLEVLSHGFPIDELMQLAMRHARGIEDLVDAAIDLFDRFVRRVDGDGADAERVADVFRRLLPAVTMLVAAHFQRTLLRRALDRLRGKAQDEALQAAVAAVESGRLEVAWH